MRRSQCLRPAQYDGEEILSAGEFHDLALLTFSVLDWFGDFTSLLDLSRNVRSCPENSFSIYRSLRAVKVLLASLCSTLTVPASRMGGPYPFALERQLFGLRQR